MKKSYKISIKIFVLLFVLFSTINVTVASTNISHEQWTKILQKNVSADGNVNYLAIKQDRTELDAYLQLLQKTHPNDSWTNNEKMAYWINAYNAFTIDLVVSEYPVKSIRNIGKGSPWDIRFIKIQDKEYSLNDIEHKILRVEFDEPRIHFAINCAAISCPKLLNEAYVAEKLDLQLEAMAKEFINDAENNRISSKKAELSNIFNWFKEDFTKNGSLIEYVNQYANTKASPKARIVYLKYNWNLNE
ncbi:MAG: DUF547 domain-containing protein [Bacteroidales bacterium]|nr:DUF547 domain-containing protein [Bacteroidales bacterium]